MSKKTITFRNYRLVPLLTIQSEDVSNFLGGTPGVYISEDRSPEWLQHLGLNKADFITYSRKKKNMFSKMAKGSVWINPTCPIAGYNYVKSWKSGSVLYLGNKSSYRILARIIHFFSIVLWLLKHRKEYAYCLVYNFHPLSFYLPPLLMKFFFKKKIYVDYEDDYTKRKDWNFFHKKIEPMLRHTVTGAICVNKDMIKYFFHKKNIVVNGFANLDYTKSIDFTINNGVKLLYSGSLDAIRGVDLIPELVVELRKHIKDFKIIITGKGPLETLVKSWRHPEISYLGFLQQDEYMKVINQADVGLVLQKPDHPFNTGSFPSKIEEYARFQKPIYILKLDT